MTGCAVRRTAASCWSTRRGGTTRLTDAATGEPLKDLAPDGLDRIIVNNRLRGAIEAALGGLTLFSPDPGDPAGGGPGHC